MVSGQLLLLVSVFIICVSCSSRSHLAPNSSIESSNIRPHSRRIGFHGSNHCKAASMSAHAHAIVTIVSKIF